MERATNSSLILYTTEDGLTKIEATFDRDTVWLSIDQMADLFQRNKSTISRHIGNIYKEGELDRTATVAKFATVEHSSSSPSSKTFWMCREIVDLSRPKRHPQERLPQAHRTSHAKQKSRRANSAADNSWSRGADLNHRPSGYEPDELTRLLHPAMGYLKGQGYILLA